jgi:hypothetical protein
VENVKNLSLLGESFDVHEDHAKWAVGTKGDLICIGDINREVFVL